MNDFTKEELIALKNGIEYLPQSVNLDNKYQEMCDGIIVKIESMIDNHPKCDHRSGLNHYNEKGEAVGYDSDIYRCRHCDILFRFTFENGQCIGHEELE